MKRVSFMLILVAVLSLAIPTFAQEEGGQGGVVFYYDTSDVSQMNPLLGEDATSSSLYGRLYPSLFGVDPPPVCWKKVLVARWRLTGHLMKPVRF